MAKLIVQHDVDPGIAVILEEVAPHDVAHRPEGCHGACTECGRLTHHWHRDAAITAAKRHVDAHESSL